MSLTVTDTIERQIEIAAPRDRVWRAITTESEFEQWFGIRIKSGKFQPGVRLEVLTTHPDYAGIVFHFTVLEMKAPEYFSWRWVPGALEPEGEATTLVEFRLEETKSGTLVTIKESGFDQISLGYRAKAFEDNTGGWEHQAKSLASYIAQKR